MGLTFKENCPDLRNSGVANVINYLKKYKCSIDLYDPWADKKEVKKMYKINPATKLNPDTYDAIILAVAHDKFKTMGAKFISALGKKNRIIYDLKYVFSKKNVDLRL
jgi:UDP-N-acetyl-D-galactosamine dehydrogenase